jgi:hypothetical protein
MNKSFLAHAIGYATVACLCIAGTAQAIPGTNTVDSEDIIDGQVTRPDIAAGAVTSGKVANDSLTGADVAENMLSFSSAGCKTGLVHSYARVKGSATMPSSFTTSSTYVDFDRSCATSGEVQVRRVGTGNYEVRFAGESTGLALATPHGGDGDSDNTISVYFDGIVTFKVIVRDQSGSLDDGWFTILSL